MKKKYKILNCCRFCGSSQIDVVLDLGEMPLAGGFLAEGELENEPTFPLELQFCSDCSMAQVSCVPDPTILFNEKYFFHSSSVQSLVGHFEDYAADIYPRFLFFIQTPVVLEIGCNDGVLLKPLAKLGAKVIGVDPSSNATSKIDIKEALVYNEFFGKELTKEILEEVGRVDLITANFSFAHIDNMHDVISGITSILNDHGVFVFEIYYLKTIIEEMNYDMIYHEHMSYYSLISLQTFLGNHAMEIFDVKYFPRIRSGALRVYAKFKSNNLYRPSEDFKKMIQDEFKLGLNFKNAFVEYSLKVDKTRTDLMNLISTLKSRGKKIVGYGASGRSTVVMNYCGINNSHIEYVVDDAIEKQGFYTPGSHLEIISWDEMEKRIKPDYIILFAWSFIDEVLQKRASFRENGGRFILPLPSVEVI